MLSRQIAENLKTFVVIFETGDELLTGLKNFAVKNKLSGSSFNAIGALSGTTLGWFN
jgi:predicted DNA-binding protein with PD1-like motif